MFGILVNPYQYRQWCRKTRQAMTINTKLALKSSFPSSFCRLCHLCVKLRKLASLSRVLMTLRRTFSQFPKCVAHKTTTFKFMYQRIPSPWLIEFLACFKRGDRIFVEHLGHKYVKTHLSM